MSEENLPFPTAMRGYDRDAVNARIAQLEDAIQSAQRAAEDARMEAQQARTSLDEAQKTLRERGVPPGIPV